MEAVTQSSLARPRHIRHLARLFSIAALFLTPFMIAAPAYADFRVCNSTQNLVGVAIGYRAQEGWVSEGWWQVPASTCATLIEGELQSRYYYLYAEDAAHGGRWTGDVNMCVAENEFKITGVDVVMPAASREWVSRNMTRADRAAGWSSFPIRQAHREIKTDEA